MFQDSLDIFIIFDHFLMVTTALLVRTSANSFAHDAVEMPFPAGLLASFNHRFKFDEELDIFLVLVSSPMRFGELLADGCNRI